MKTLGHLAWTLASAESANPQPRRKTPLKVLCPPTELDRAEAAVAPTSASGVRGSPHRRLVQGGTVGLKGPSALALGRGGTD